MTKEIRKEYGLTFDEKGKECQFDDLLDEHIVCHPDKSMGILVEGTLDMMAEIEEEEKE